MTTRTILVSYHRLRSATILIFPVTGPWIYTIGIKCIDYVPDDGEIYKYEKEYLLREPEYESPYHNPMPASCLNLEMLNSLILLGNRKSEILLAPDEFECRIRIHVAFLMEHAS